MEAYVLFYMDILLAKSNIMETETKTDSFIAL